MALMRQYSLEHAADGITVNAVNPDRIRTGLMTDEMVEERAQARGVTPEVYMRGNLLKREVLANDVADAFCTSFQLGPQRVLLSPLTAAMLPR